MFLATVSQVSNFYFHFQVNCIFQLKKYFPFTQMCFINYVMLLPYQFIIKASKFRFSIDYLITLHFKFFPLLI